MSAKTFTREQIIKAVQDAADAWQPNLQTPYEEMVARFLFKDEGYVDPEPSDTKPELSDAQYQEANEAWIRYADEAEFHVHDVVQEQFIEGYLEALKAHPSLPTHEQIAEAVASGVENWEVAILATVTEYQRSLLVSHVTESMLTLVQNGADR